MNTIFLPGARVKTNKGYLEKNNRTVRGVIVETRTEIGEGNVIVRWNSQEGKVVDLLQGCMVVMSKTDIESDDSE